MWYFTWILGVGFAAAFAIINAMWLESVCDIDNHGIDAACGSVSDDTEEPKS
ncbi:cytochrome bd-I oxidase subunit CydX [Methylovulum psychrotolerans]|jgi:cyd operon protein YbgT|uniref:Cytochrome bd-I oxidase subunit CydX n=1 Tax=Methylovulum psychrotolerans TaxID=1704499 RepID=A0A2S5CMI7_9GAMM|nr:cytochrome bd-I oxidase subunit CydX [Methylovulum psychrotolerans]